MEMKAKEIVIKGKVHDVGYRLFLLSEAERLFIEKFDARNVLINGEQHLIVLVGGAEDKISRFVEFAESNYPPEASVESVEVKYIVPKQKSYKTENPFSMWGWINARKLHPLCKGIEI